MFSEARSSPGGRRRRRNEVSVADGRTPGVGRERGGTPTCHHHPAGRPASFPSRYVRRGRATAL